MYLQMFGLTLEGFSKMFSQMWQNKFILEEVSLCGGGVFPESSKTKQRSKHLMVGVM
jgi:hypothetical protein